MGPWLPDFQIFFWLPTACRDLSSNETIFYCIDDLFAESSRSSACIKLFARLKSTPEETSALYTLNTISRLRGRPHRSHSFTYIQRLQDLTLRRNILTHLHGLYEDPNGPGSTELSPGKEIALHPISPQKVYNHYIITRRIWRHLREHYLVLFHSSRGLI